MMQDEMIEGREIADLLPFYAIGRLSSADNARVETALATDPALRRELDLVSEERDATIHVNEAVAGPSRAAQDRFFAMLDTQPKRRARFDLAGWVSSKLEAIQPRNLAFAACALALVIAVQGGLIGTMMMSSSRPGGFETASVSQQAVPGTGALVVVSFMPTATAAEIGTLLSGVSGSIVAGPMAGGLYQIRIGDKPLSDAETAALVSKLKAKSALVRFAAPVGGAAE